MFAQPLHGKKSQPGINIKNIIFISRRFVSFYKIMLYGFSSPKSRLFFLPLALPNLFHSSGYFRINNMKIFSPWVGCLYCIMFFFRSNDGNICGNRSFRLLLFLYLILLQVLPFFWSWILIYIFTSIYNGLWKCPSIQ